MPRIFIVGDEVAPLRLRSGGAFPDGERRSATAASTAATARVTAACIPSMQVKIAGIR